MAEREPSAGAPRHRGGYPQVPEKLLKSQKKILSDPPLTRHGPTGRMRCFEGTPAILYLHVSNLV